jgi:hypothetical protein
MDACELIQRRAFGLPGSDLPGYLQVLLEASKCGLVLATLLVQTPDKAKSTSTKSTVAGFARDLEHHFGIARRTIEVAGAAQQFAQHVRGSALIIASAGGVGFGHNLFQQWPDRNRVLEPELLGKE